MIIGSIIASYKTIEIAIKNPVQDSNLFLQNYHITDKHINSILQDQIYFNSRYSISLSETQFSENSFKGSFKVFEGEKEVVSKIDGVITRPETTEFDTTFEGGNFEFKVPKSGRWNFYIKAEVDGKIGYFYFELDTRDLGDFKILDPFISHKRVENIKNSEAERVQKLLQN
jgi:hypothetical protein